MHLKTLATSLCAVAIAGPLWAETQVDERRTINAGAELEVTTVSGDVDFIATSGSELVITGQLADNVEELRIEGDPDDWSVKVIHKDRDGWNWKNRDAGRTYLEIRLPAGTNLEAESVSGDISVTGMSPEYLDIENVSGDVTVSESSPVSIDVETVSGDMEIFSGGSESTELKSVSGNITAEGIAGSLSVGTVSGNATITSGPLEEGDFETVSGSMQLDLALNAISELDVSSHSGDISVALPGDLPIRLDAESHRTSIDGEELSLTPTEFRLLQALMERRGRTQSRKQLLEKAWDVESGVSDRIQTRTVDMHVRRLRAKLGDFGEWIQTVRGFGYRLKVPEQAD